MTEANNRTQAKRWCFTINNPTEEDIALLIGTRADGAQAKLNEVEYMIFQEERGESGTLHWQGFMILKNKKTLAWLKRNINGRAHWEVARATNEQARDYCRKEDTYTGGRRHEYGHFPERAPLKKRDERIADAAAELDVVKEGYKRPSEIASITLMQQGFLSAYKELTADILGPYRPDLRIITMVGRPGTGKSYCIQKYFPEHGKCIMGNNGCWFQNPLAKVMVFEEFCGQIPLQKMLLFLDPGKLALEVKCGMRPALYNLVIITSNTRPDGWYKGDEAGQPGKRTDSLLALFDRINFACGSYIPVRNMGLYLEPPAGMNIMDCRMYFDNAILKFTGQPEPVTDSEDDEPEHEELPDEEPSDSDDEQAARRDIGYADH